MCQYIDVVWPSDPARPRFASMLAPAEAARTLAGGRPRRPNRRVVVAIEGHPALMRQRDDRRDLVPTLRVYLQVGGAVRRASRFPLTPPPGRG